MTLDEIRNSTKEVLTPADIADVLNADPQNIRIQARMAPERLGFPVCVIGTRTKIPKRAFIAYMEGKATV